MRRGRTISLTALVCLLAFATGVEAGGPGTDEAWQVHSGSVRVVCPLTVGGSFEATTNSIAGSLAPGTAGGSSSEFVVDLNSLDTGINLRNQHMRDHYLETGRGDVFAHAVLSNVAVSGISVSNPSGHGNFTGTLRLHGVTQQVAGQVEARTSGGSIDVQATFPVALSRFNIAAPRYLGVGVKDEVVVHVNVRVAPR